MDFNNVPVPGVLMRPESMPPWKIGRVLDYQDMIEGWLSGVRALAQQMLESGQAVPGYKLVDGRTSRKWKDGDGTTAANKYGILHGDKVFAPRKVKSVAQMEALVGKKNLDVSLYETTPGHKKVANDSDPRPETASTAQAEFAAVTPHDPFLGREVLLKPPVLEPVLYDPFLAPAAAKVVEPEVMPRTRKIWPD